MNCRTHEHRHFERTLRSTDTIPGPRLAEGCSRKPKTACVACRFSLSVSLCPFLPFNNPPSFFLTIYVRERFRVGEKVPGRRIRVRADERTYATYERLLDARRRSSRSCRDRASRTHARYVTLSCSRETTKNYLCLSLSFLALATRRRSYLNDIRERFRVGRRARRRIRIRERREPFTDLRECSRRRESSFRTTARLCTASCIGYRIYS